MDRQSITATGNASKRHFTELPPLSLYVHLPWCIRKCPYCDFNSHEQQTDALPEADYIDALIADLEQEMPDVWGRQLTSIFIGGGTPSLFDPSSIERLLSGVRALAAYSPSIEVTMEANPGTFEQDRFQGFRDAGVNRLSIGIQSFNNSSLEALGRVHDGQDATRAVNIARKAGFKNINLDLMFGLPAQSLSDAIKDVSTAIALQPEHISYYQLTLESNTLFAARPPKLPKDDCIWEIQDKALKLLTENDYQRYEISAFAKPGKQSVHNLNYWLFGDYLGIGAGAHAKLSFADSGEIRRSWKIKHPVAYLENASSQNRIGGAHEVSVADTGIEFMMNALRLINGFPIPVFQRHTGVDFFRYQPTVAQAIKDGLLVQTAFDLKPTQKGSDFLNDLLERFMEPQSTRHYPIIKLNQRE